MFGENQIKHWECLLTVVSEYLFSHLSSGNIYIHRIIILYPKLRRMRLVGYAAFIGDIRSTFVTKPEEKSSLWRQGIDVRILIWHTACHLDFTFVKFFCMCVNEGTRVPITSGHQAYNLYQAVSRRLQ